MRGVPATRRPTTGAPEAGFSLLELVIAMFILTEVMGAILLLFTGLSDIARAQTNIAEVQQSQRISHRNLTQIIREAGLGGLPVTVAGPQGAPGVFPDGLAIALRDNVPADSRILPTVATSDRVLEGSDVLIVRGVFSTPVYYLTPQVETRDVANPLTSLLTGAAEPFLLSGRQLVIPARFLLVTQDFQPLIDALTAQPRRLLIVRDLLNPQSYGLLETTGIAQLPAASPAGNLTLNVTFSDSADALFYAELVPPRPGSFSVQLGAGSVPFPKRIGAVGMLDEFRYYIRPDEGRQMGLGDRSTTIPTPMLSRISVLPETDVQIGNRLDIADRIFDLQIAVGIDTSPECPPVCTPATPLTRGVIAEDGTAGDEVFFNHPADAPGNLPSFVQSSTGRPEFQFVRLTTLQLAGRIERGHVGTPIGQIEDRIRRLDEVTFGSGIFSYSNSLRNYRRRLLSTVVDLRNLK